MPSLFGCFGGNRREQPEIRYEIDRDGHGVLQPVEVALPMPNESELDAIFSELVVGRVSSL